MKPMVNIFGIVLIIFGLAVLGYKGFTYTQQEQVAQIGNLQVTSNTEKTVYFSPFVGGVSLVAGIVLIAINRKR